MMHVDGVVSLALGAYDAYAFFQHQHTCTCSIQCPIEAGELPGLSDVGNSVRT